MKNVWAKESGVYKQVQESLEHIPAGYYKCDIANSNVPILRPSALVTDNLITLPDIAALKVLSEFKAFWGLKERFQQRGLLHKRGILMWGEPGTGKTASVLLMADQIIKQYDGVVCQVSHPEVAAKCFAMIREIEPDRPIFAFMEDFESLVASYKPDGFLSLLDGENQVGGIVFVATTNYPDKLDKRFTDRPSRFDLIIEIPPPSAASRRQYLLSRDPSIKDIDAWVEKTNTFSVAYLRELIILVQCFQMPLLDAVERLHQMRKNKLTKLSEPAKW